MIEVDLSSLPALTNDCFYDKYWDESRYMLLYGGAGSGKSVFAAQKWIVRLMSENEHKLLFVRKVAKTLRNSVFAEIRGLISRWGLSALFKINKSDMEITCINGNSIIFVGIDDPEKMKSISGITGIWIEEASELTQEDFQQLDLRLRGFTYNYKQIVISFNPISITHWLKKVFFDKKKKNSTVLHTTYKDNRFIDDDYKTQLEELKEQDPHYYLIYCLGQWGVLGKTVFNTQLVTNRLIQLKERSKVIKRGNLVYRLDDAERIIDKTIEFVEDWENYSLSVYEEPIDLTPYVIGGDTAEGGHDWSIGKVRNNITWNEAAVWRAQMDTDLYAKDMYCLGRMYNDALIGIETNFDTHPVKELKRLGYSKQYVREILDKVTKEVQWKHGFVTTKVTRPIIVSKYVAMVREHIELFHDEKTLEEMLTFVRNQNGKPAAQEGHHDDTIMADAIALEIRTQQSMEKLPFVEPKKPLPLAFQTEVTQQDDYTSW